MRHGLVDQHGKFKKRVASLDTSPYKVVTKGQLVVGFPIDEGVLSFQNLYDNAIVSPAYEIWELTNPASIYRPYLERYLKSPHALWYYSSKLQGTTARRRNLPRDIFLKMPIPLPDYGEQTRITDVLDWADLQRSKRNKAIELLEQLSQSIFIDLFGDPGSDTMNWPRTTVESVAEQVTDGEHLTPKRELQGIKLLSARNVRDGYLDLENVDYVGPEEYERIRKHCDPQRGDILISCSGTIGRVAAIETDEPLSLVRSAALIRPNPPMVTTEYLVSLLRTPFLKAEMIRKANASSQANLFQGPIRKLPVMLPPLKLQAVFSQRMNRLVNIRQMHFGHLAELDALFTSLQYRAFRGEL